jgi:hypothetical protein
MSRLSGRSPKSSPNASICRSFLLLSPPPLQWRYRLCHPRNHPHPPSSRRPARRPNRPRPRPRHCTCPRVRVKIVSGRWCEHLFRSHSIKKTCNYCVTLTHAGHRHFSMLDRSLQLREVYFLTFTLRFMLISSSQLKNFLEQGVCRSTRVFPLLKVIGRPLIYSGKFSRYV